MSKILNEFITSLPPEARKVAEDALVKQRQRRGIIEKSITAIKSGDIVDPDYFDPMKSLQLAPPLPNVAYEQEEKQRQFQAQQARNQMLRDITPEDEEMFADMGISGLPEISEETKELQTVVEALENDPYLQSQRAVDEGITPFGTDDITAGLQLMEGQPPTANLDKHLGVAALTFERQGLQPRGTQPPVEPPQQQPHMMGGSV